MKIVQVIGSPCSGKSTFLRRFVSENPQWKLFDIVDYRYSSEEWLVAENYLIKDILYKEYPYVIIESAQGLHELNALNIEFYCDIQTLIKRHQKRGLEVTDEDLQRYSILKMIGIKPQFTIDTSENISYEHLASKFFKVIHGI